MTLNIYNSSGIFVKTIFRNVQNAGEHTIQWDATKADGQKVFSGLYIVEISIGDRKEQTKIVLNN